MMGLSARQKLMMQCHGTVNEAFERDFHIRIKGLLTPRVQGYVMGHLRETLEAVPQARIAELEWQVAHLEELRPHWAEGHTSDGVAAQCKTDALNALWKLLNATNQTQAVTNLHALLEIANCVPEKFK